MTPRDIVLHGRQVPKRFNPLRCEDRASLKLDFCFGAPSQNNRGNSTSSASAGNRSDTFPFGVSDASRPVVMVSLSMRRADRTGSPVMWPASPRSTSLRTSASVSSAYSHSIVPGGLEVTS